MHSATSSATSSAAGASRSNVYRGADLRYNLEITLEEAARGTETKIRIPTLEECETCHGSGAKPGTQPVTCTTCDGHGQVRMQQGFFSIQQTCPKCHGTGKIMPTPCATCRGAGRLKQHKTLSVKIPAGVDEGDRIRLSGEGEAGRQRRPAGRPVRGDPPQAHAVFQRDHNDLHCEMPISFTTAALGGDIEIPTLDGYAKIKIPSETQTGKVFRLRGKGIKGVRSSAHGDLMCHVVVETPVNLTARQSELLQRVRSDQCQGFGQPQPAREVAGWTRSRSSSRNSDGGRRVGATRYRVSRARSSRRVRRRDAP